LEVLDLLLPLQVDEVALGLGLAMKETQPDLWFSPDEQRAKRWRKYTTNSLMMIHAS
jgi:hypothetical protein